MSDRLHILLTAGEKERYREIAEAQGLNLSAWVRRAVREAAARYGEETKLRTPEDLRRFFDGIDAARDPSEGPEPDWEDHLRLVEEGKRGGLSP